MFTLHRDGDGTLLLAETIRKPGVYKVTIGTRSRSKQVQQHSRPFELHIQLAVIQESSAASLSGADSTMPPA